MYSRFISWSRGVYLAGIVLALVLVIPTVWFPFQLTKLSAFALCAFVAAVLFVLGGGTKELVRSRGFWAACAALLLPLAYAISYRFALDPSVAFAGFGVETDTVLFTLLASIAFILSFAFFRTLRTVRLLLTVLSCALAAAAFFQLISIVFGTNAIPLQTFADRSVNLVGKWNDLGLLIGLLAMMLLVRVELMASTTIFRAGAAVVGVVLAVLLGVINFPLIWGLVLAFAIVLALAKFITQKEPESAGATLKEHAWVRRLPWFSGVAAIIAVVFLFFGATFNTGLTNIFPVSSLEVRPSYQSTLAVNDVARGDSFVRLLIGSGPNSFGEQWLMHKPGEVNQSPFWNVDFNIGFSTFTTALGSVGLFGLIGWIVPLLLVLAGAVRVFRLSVLGREDKGVAGALVIGSLFLLVTLALYVPSQNITLLAFVLSGATFGFLWRQGQPARPDGHSGGESSATAERAPTRLAALLMGVAVLVFLLLVLFASGSTARRFASELFVNRGIVALQAQNSDAALQNAARAAGFETTGNVLRLAATAGGSKLVRIAQDTTLSQEEARASFEAALQQTIAAGGQAAALNPRDYRPYLLLANVYDFLATLNVQGAYESAVTAYEEAGKRNPMNPGIPLAIARLEVASNNVDAARAQVGKALTLKPNYTDAILLVVQLDVAANDIPSAIQAATAAAQTAPGVAPIWFQLGLLYYAAGNATNAALALEQAISLVPDYANAKYFLGLSYATLSRNEEAIQQFKDLAKTNPDNVEVALIVSNLEAGKAPFEGTVSPVTPKSQVRPPAPIEE